MRGTNSMQFPGVLADRNVVEPGLFCDFLEGVKAIQQEPDHVRVGQRVDFDDPHHSTIRERIAPKARRNAATARMVSSSSTR